MRFLTVYEADFIFMTTSSGPGCGRSISWNSRTPGLTRILASIEYQFHYRTFSIVLPDCIKIDMLPGFNRASIQIGLIDARLKPAGMTIIFTLLYLEDTSHYCEMGY